MQTLHFHKTVEELLKENSSPIPLNVFPDLMGINLCSVAFIDWDELPDKQLVNLKIEFIPNKSDVELMQPIKFKIESDPNSAYLSDQYIVNWIESKLSPFQAENSILNQTSFSYEVMFETISSFIKEHLTDPALK